MASIKELLREEENGTLSFGDYELSSKTKLADFQFKGDTYKVKTFKEMTRLEKNGKVAYESVPGSAVHDYEVTKRSVSFAVEAPDDVQITIEGEPEKDYKVLVDDTNIGKIRSSLSGKINFSLELNPGETARVKVTKVP